jgi:hypothetical protein
MSKFDACKKPADIKEKMLLWRFAQLDGVYPLETELQRWFTERDESPDGERSKNVYLNETVLYPFVFKAFHYIFCPS